MAVGVGIDHEDADLIAHLDHPVSPEFVNRRRNRGAAEPELLSQHLLRGQPVPRPQSALADVTDHRLLRQFCFRSGHITFLWKKLNH
ncbi:hypothetical protein SDC9_164019 [bioreactor metagenome]|uniref:Uncharacterized protein n=1 Tax=bioreactor metagenome TaxID=1076179 RepID=A0A645FXP9_9ZZZZ